MSIDKLKAYESNFDSWVKELPILKLPVRAPLAALHEVSDGLFNGSRGNEKHAPRPEAGTSLAGRLSYLMPLLMGCDTEPVGTDAENALQAVRETDPNCAQRAMLLGYSHFCELMPEVHRGYYSVEGDEEAGFLLRHASEAFSSHEALDIILAELSLSLVIDVPEFLHAELFDGLARTVPVADAGTMGRVLRECADHYRKYFNEPPFMTEEGYHAAVGVTSDDFVRFRAALCAMADYAKGMADALDRRIRREGDPDGRLRKEMLEWISVHWRENPFFGFLKALSDVDFDKLDRLVALFSVDFRTGKKSGAHARDGFLPPVARLETSVLYNPDLLKLFLPARNILFAVHHQDAKRFDDLVSKHLEPALVQQAVDLLRPVPGLITVVGHEWAKGELDLLVYSPQENVVLHMQAKAAIPPQGARMVQAIEGRAREGLDQLKRFRDLPGETRDEVLSRALGRTVSGVKVIDVLLSRSCFGTTKTWSKLGSVVPLNLTLLSGVTKPVRTAGHPLPLGDFPARVWEEINRVMREARPQWVTKEAILGPVVFRLPMLDYDNEAVRLANIRMWT
ncbi:MAG: hypothetical protein U0797_24440 [Gemmataceae bacterium]